MGDSMACIRHSKMAWFLIVAAAFAFSACSGGKKARVSRVRPINIYELKSTALPRFDIPVEVNDRVIAWIEYFQGPGRRHFEKYLRRSGRYAPMIREILKEENVPQDLVYISMIESGFSPHAYSRASAVGFWQFIRSTGKIYGLDIDRWVDERRDLEKSTRAAAHFFRDLHRDYGDWYLAMVGYNAGPRRVEQAIGMTRSRNFWDMAAHRSALRAETRDYVPKFIAAAIISKMPERFGFDDIQYESPLEFDTVTVDTQTDMSVIAECAGTDQGTITDLNPHLHSGITPPVGNYEVRVPRGTSGAFKVAYAKVPREERVRIVRYKVRKGDTLHGVARRFGVDPNALAEANGIRPKRGLKRGTILSIPAKGASAKMLARASDGDESRSSSRAKKIVHHQVLAGETIGGIASRYGVKTSQILAWNHLSRKAMLRRGQKLRIYKAVASSEETSDDEPVAQREASTERHKVRKGETLGQLAGRYGVTTDQLMAWNNIRSPRELRYGQNLIVAKHVEPIPSVEREKKIESTGVNLAEMDNKSPIKTPSPPVGEGRGEGEGIEGFETDSKKTVITKSFVEKEYVVKRGDTIGAIAKRHGVTSGELMAWNGITNASSLRAGSRLKVYASKGSGAASAKPKAQALVSGENIYRVRQGDTLWDIARRNNVSISDIQAWNNLKDPSDVRPGTTLIIRQN